MLKHPTVWLLAIIMFCCQTGSYGLTLWVPTIVKGLSGFTNMEVGLISALPYIAAAVGMVLIGRSCRIAPANVSCTWRYPRRSAQWASCSPRS